MTSALNLSRLSRGIGEVKQNGHEKVEVKLEPEDYFNWADNPNRLYLPPLQPKVAFEDADTPRSNVSNFSTKSYQEVNLPKTYLTRRGAMLLFSEDIARKGGRNRRKRRRHHQLSKSMDDLELKTVDDLKSAILSYGASAQRDEDVYLGFIHRNKHKNSWQRNVRPGFSARRYLGNLTRSIDDSLLTTMSNKGYLCDGSLFETSMFFPHMKKRISDNLSHVPLPYRIMRQMLMSPGQLSGYSYYRGRSVTEETMHEDEEYEVQSNISDVGSIKIVEERNGIVREISYSELDKKAQAQVLTDLLVKSALNHAIGKTQQMIDESMSVVSGEGDQAQYNSLPDFNMEDAVQTYLDSSDMIDGDKTRAAQLGGSLKGGKLPSYRADAFDSGTSRTGSWAQQASEKEYIGGIPVASVKSVSEVSGISGGAKPPLPPIQSTLSPIKSVIDGTPAKDVLSLNNNNLVPPINIEPPTPQHSSLSNAQTGGPTPGPLSREPTLQTMKEDTLPEEETDGWGVGVNDKDDVVSAATEKQLDQGGETDDAEASQKSMDKQSLHSGPVLAGGSHLHSSSESVISAVQSFKGPELPVVQLGSGLKGSQKSVKSSSKSPSKAGSVKSLDDSASQSHKGSVIFGPGGAVISVGGSVGLKQDSDQLSIGGVSDSNIAVPDDAAGDADVSDADLEAAEWRSHVSKSSRRENVKPYGYRDQDEIDVHAGDMDPMQSIVIKSYQPSDGQSDSRLSKHSLLSNTESAPVDASEIEIRLDEMLHPTLLDDQSKPGNSRVASVAASDGMISFQEYSVPSQSAHTPSIIGVAASIKPDVFESDTGVSVGGLSLGPTPSLHSPRSQLAKQELPSGTQSRRSSLSQSIMSEKDLIETLTEHAQKIADDVLSMNASGNDLVDDARIAAEKWMEKYPVSIISRSQSLQGLSSDYKVIEAMIQRQQSKSAGPTVDEYADLIRQTLSSVLSRRSSVDIPVDAELSPELINALIKQTITPDDIEVIHDAESGKSVIRARSSSMKSTISEAMGGVKEGHTYVTPETGSAKLGSKSIPSERQTDADVGEPDVINYGQREGESVEGEPSTVESVKVSPPKEEIPVPDSVIKTGSGKSGRTKSHGGKSQVSFADGGAPGMEDLSEKERTQLEELVKVGSGKGSPSKSSKGSPTGKKSSTSKRSGSKEEFVVGKVEDKKELEKLYAQPPLPPLKKETKAKPVKEKKTKEKVVKKKEPKKKKEAKKKKPEKEKTPTPPPVKVEDPTPPEKEPSEETSPQPTPTPEPVEEPDMEFIIMREEFSPDIEEEPQEMAKSVKSIKSAKSIAQSVISDISDDFSDTGSESSSAFKMISNQEARAAKRAAQAEKRRLQVEAKRRDKEEKIRREKEAVEARERMKLEFEEERRRKEEAVRLKKQQQEDEELRAEEMEREAERRKNREAEREKRQREEHQRRLEEMKKKQAEEDARRKEEAAQREAEEEERRKVEQVMLSRMKEEERIEYERKKREEEERQAILREQERIRLEEEQRLAMEEARRLAEEMERKRKELEDRLLFNRSLQLESNGLTHSQDITRAFVFSYYELLQWLGLDAPEFEKRKKELDALLKEANLSMKDFE